MGSPVHEDYSTGLRDPLIVPIRGNFREIEDFTVTAKDEEIISDPGRLGSPEEDYKNFESYKFGSNNSSLSPGNRKQDELVDLESKIRSMTKLLDNMLMQKKIIKDELQKSSPQHNPKPTVFQLWDKLDAMEQ